MKDNTNSDSLISAVVVTYGDRWSYLKVLLDHLEKEARVVSVVVVDNASRSDISAACCQAGFNKAVVLRQEKNIGSAGGFSTGIQYAISLEAEYIMLFDDDTVPRSETINKLLERLIEINIRYGNSLNAVIPNRNSQILCLKSIFDKHDHWMQEESVLGLNAFNFFQRHLKKILTSKKKIIDVTGTVDYGLAAYAGLMFHKLVCDRIGFPESSLILYYDDIEYTNRFLSAGGKIFACTDLGMDDIVENYSSSMMSRPFLGLILADHDGKSYYQVRNQIYFEYNFIARYKATFLFNVIVYSALSLIVSVACLKFSRAKVIQTAIYDGIKGNLGFHEDYPLD
ncbi:MAG: glycosyltransferase [Desulfuromonadales bacterium]